MNGPDRGAASVLLLAAGAVVVATGVAGAAAGAARVAGHEARTAADLGALAGAQRVFEGEPAACAAAARYAAANGARTISCRLTGTEIVIRVEVTVESLPGRASAAARAAPVVAW